MPSAHAAPDRPENIPALFVDAWNRRDPDALAALFEADADFVNVVGIWWEDREAIRQAHAYGLTRIFQHSTLRLGRVKLRQLSDDIAVVHARMSLSGQTAADGVPVPGVRHNLFPLSRTARHRAGVACRHTTPTSSPAWKPGWWTPTGSCVRSTTGAADPRIACPAARGNANGCCKRRKRGMS